MGSLESLLCFFCCAIYLLISVLREDRSAIIIIILAIFRNNFSCHVLRCGMCDIYIYIVRA